VKNKNIAIPQTGVKQKPKSTNLLAEYQARKITGRELETALLNEVNTARQYRFALDLHLADDFEDLPAYLKIDILLIIYKSNSHPAVFRQAFAKATESQYLERLLGTMAYYKIKLSEEELTAKMALLSLLISPRKGGQELLEDLKVAIGDYRKSMRRSRGR